MAHPLDGARAKIERAGDHLEALDAVLARFSKDGGFRMVGEYDAETGEAIFRSAAGISDHIWTCEEIAALLD